MEVFGRKIGTLPFILVTGLIVRLSLSPFFGDHYDMSYWTSIILDIKNGDGLYADYDMWYPPVWGYVLVLVTPIFDIFNISPTMFLEETISSGRMDTGEGWVPSVAAMVIIKLPLILADLVNCGLIYRIVKRITNDEKKAAYSAALWMFNPLTVWVSSMYGQFESICLMFTLLALYAYFEKSYVFCGMAIATAILTKVSPAFILIVMMALIVTRDEGWRTPSKNIMLLTAGGLTMTCLILLPQIVNGEMEFVLSFLTRATGEYPVPYGYTPASMTSVSLLPSYHKLGYSGRLVPTLVAVLIITVYVLAKRQFDEKGTILVATAALCTTLLWLPDPGYTWYATPIIGFLCICSSFSRLFEIPIWCLTILCAISVLAIYRGSYSLAELGICSIQTIKDASDTISGMFSPLNQAINIDKFIPLAAATLFALYLSRRSENDEQVS